MLKGSKISEELKQKMRESKINFWSSEKGKEMARKLSEDRKGKFNIGRIVTEETRRKISESKMGNKNPMYGKSGVLSPNFNYNPSKETRLKISKANTGKKRSIENREKLSKAFKESWKTEEGTARKKHMSELMKGKFVGEKHPQYGTHHSPERIVRDTKRRLEFYQSNEGKKLRKQWSLERSGEGNANWQNGISFEPYSQDFNDHFKKLIKERDNYCCGLCGTYEVDAINLCGQGLVVHHINYVKADSYEQNCITLCRRCHCMTNYDRETWIVHLQTILTKRYNYQYTPEGKIIIEIKE